MVPESSAWAPVPSVCTRYDPRPMNAVRTSWVRSRSTSNTGVRFSNIGMPIVSMYSGRNEPRPASV